MTHKTEICNICGRLPHETETKRLVRDHDHKTGFIRGMLCDRCNQALGVYESLNRFITKYRKKRYWLWVHTFKNKIEEHLKCNTGVKYYGIDGFAPSCKSGRLPLPRTKRLAA